MEFAMMLDHFNWMANIAREKSLRVLECGGKRSATPLWEQRRSWAHRWLFGNVGALKAASSPSHSKT
jgi:hypothetical protein